MTLYILLSMLVHAALLLGFIFVEKAPDKGDKVICMYLAALLAYGASLL